MKTVDRRILALSLPAVIATITTPLLGLMDTAFTGHMGGAVYLAAIAVGGNMFNLMYWLFSFLRAGTSGLTAQCVGSGDTMGVNAALLRALAVAWCAGVAIIVLQRPIEWLFGYFMAPDDATWQQACLYFRILVWGAPAMLSTYAFAGWFVGIQRARAAMVMSIAIDVINLAVSIILVVGLRWKVEGVAYGTLAAQWGGCAIALTLAMRTLRGGMPCVAHVFERKAMSRFFGVNRDIFLRTLFLIAVTLWFTRVGAQQGETVLAANAIIMQMFLLFSYFTDGIAYAAEALVGESVGARNRREMHTVVRAVMRWSAWVAIAFTAIYFVAGTEIIGLLSNDGPVQQMAADYWPWAVAIPLTSFAAFSWDGIFIGATHTRPMLWSMAIATAIYFTVYLLLYHRWGNHALWLAFILYLLSRSAVLHIFYRRYIR